MEGEGLVQSQIGELSNSVGFKGTTSHKYAEPGNKVLTSIDNSNRYSNNIRTSVDCYVSGQYVTRKGKVFEVKQRYTIFIAYNRDSQGATMHQVRDRITNDFQARYGRTFNVVNVFVPMLMVPAEDIPGLRKGADIPLEFYRGTDMVRSVTRFERFRWDVGTEKVKSHTNIESIRRRYRLGKR